MVGCLHCLVKTQPMHASALTVAVVLSPFARACAPAAGAASVVAFVEAGASESLLFVVAGPEGCSPLAAEELVVDALSSMGAGRPTDCASFTTSLVTCSAITVFETAAGEKLLLDCGSACARTVTVGAADADGSVSCPEQRSSSM